ncbi:MAG: kinase [Lachnospiraceae bacterium]|nr:kinase [Lachnospiraceae bacterium]
MSTLIILRGNSGSGKSSVAKALQRKFGRNTLVISQDIIRREMLWVCDGEDTLALPLLTELLRYGNAHCKYIILEGILNADWYRPLFELAIEIFKDKIFAYYYDIPFEETLKRHETKDKKFEFGEKEMRKWWNEKDFIGIIPEKVLKQEISFEEAVNIIFRDISI